MAKLEMGPDYHLGQELVVEDALSEGEPVPLLLPEPDLANEKRVLRVLTNEERLILLFNRRVFDTSFFLFFFFNEERVLPGQ